VSVDAIKDEYVRLRRMGLDGGSALAQLAVEIALLNDADQLSLFRALETWEQSNDGLPPAFPDPDEVTVIEATNLRAREQIRCPNCGKLNPSNQVMCYACGQFIVLNHNKFATQPLNATGDNLPPGSYFGPHSLLVFKIKLSGEIFIMRPQLKPDLFLIGRGVNGVVKADRDLGAPLPAMLGVSRVHLGLMYDAQRCLLTVMDMGSSNGTLHNGQPLYAGETHILRHGDELLLGRLPLAVTFHHPIRENDSP